MQSINLVPQSEVQEQTKSQVLKVSTVFTIIVLVIVASISAYYIIQTLTLNSNIKARNDEITKFRSDITALSPIEISARNLDKKYKTIQETLAAQTKFSILLTELRARKPEGVSVDTFIIQNNTKINISGSGDSYAAIASYMNNFIDPNFSGGEPSLKKLFTGVTLNSVVLEKSRNNVRFSAAVDIEPSLLTLK